MPLEPMQCPQCGGPQQVEASAGVVSCSYCGSRLRINPGASGHPVGVPDEIKNDTAIIACQTAITHLEQQLLALRARRDALAQRCQQLAAQAMTTPPEDARLGVVAGWALALMSGGLFFAGLFWSEASVACISVSILLGVCSFIVERQAKAQIQDALALADAGRQGLRELKPALDDAQEEIRSAEARIDELKAEIGRPAREV